MDDDNNFVSHERFLNFRDRRKLSSKGENSFVLPDTADEKHKIEEMAYRESRDILKRITQEIVILIWSSIKRGDKMFHILPVARNDQSWRIGMEELQELCRNIRDGERGLGVNRALSEWLTHEFTEKTPILCSSSRGDVYLELRRGQ